MSDEFVYRPFPRGPLIAVAVMLGFLILMVGYARITGTKAELAPLPPVVESRDIRFVDLPDGSLAVHDVATGALIQTLPPGREGFIRGVLRSLERQRKGHKATLAEPFHLTRRQDGNMTLEDPTTGILLDLKAFGHTNATAFAPFLPPPSAPQ